MTEASAQTIQASSDTIQELRSIAERHIREIQEEKEQEEREDLRRLEELQHYARPRRREKIAKTTTTMSTTASKMRSAHDVLDRMHWDDSLDASKFTIGYLERFTGIKEIPASSWVSEFTEEEWIPQHRIKYFKQRNDNGEQVTVWDREKRIDRIFGSGLTNLEEAKVCSRDRGVVLAQ
ncbi:poly(A) polymerase [Exophiala viscosa]|uniref:poly(A) polymerase n=1 Tax=Exophiala viscosa TaxID=2486360 RepID=UPI00218FDB45|nr:poly(A) polymerase [Exophiala viscosa]